MSNTQTQAADIAHQVLIVDIIAPTANKAVFLNGSGVLYADSNAGGLFDTVDTVAQNLAQGLGVNIEYANANPRSVKWSWSEIEEDLRESGSFRDPNASSDNSDSEAELPVLTQVHPEESGSDYVLDVAKGGVWIKVRNVDINIVPKLDEDCLLINTYAEGHLNDPLNSDLVYFQDAQEIIDGQHTENRMN